jgi:hypothetical protein
MRVISEVNELVTLPNINKKPVKKIALGGISFNNKKSTMSTKSRFLKKFGSPKRQVITEVSDNDSVNSESKLLDNNTSQLNTQTNKILKLSEIHQTYL